MDVSCLLLLFGASRRVWCHSLSSLLWMVVGSGIVSGNGSVEVCDLCLCLCLYALDLGLCSYHDHGMTGLDLDCVLFSLVHRRCCCTCLRAAIGIVCVSALHLWYLLLLVHFWCGHLLLCRRRRVCLGNHGLGVSAVMLFLCL